MFNAWKNEELAEFEEDLVANGFVPEFAESLVNKIEDLLDTAYNYGRQTNGSTD